MNIYRLSVQRPDRPPRLAISGVDRALMSLVGGAATEGNVSVALFLPLLSSLRDKFPAGDQGFCGGDASTRSLRVPIGATDPMKILLVIIAVASVQTAPLHSLNWWTASGLARGATRASVSPSCSGLSCGRAGVSSPARNPAS